MIHPRSIPRHLAAAAGLAALGLLLLAPQPTAAATPEEVAALAQQYLDAGEPEKALEAIEKEAGRQVRGNGALLLLRSTAHFVLGDTEKGRRDLEAALEADPTLRQAWLNRAALDLAEERYPEALTALKTAEELDPEAPDNHLNIGAVLLLRGDLAGAAERFRRYLAGGGGTAEGYYLVASNYASSGHGDLAVEHLGRAIGLDEKSRLAARGDANFQPLVGTASYDRLMAADPAPPGAGAYVAQRTFHEAYGAGQGKLLPAVLSALQLTGERFDPRVEVTDRWALIWGAELRIVVRSKAASAGSAEAEEGLVEISAPAERFSTEAWQERTEGLFRRIQTRLITGG